MKSGIGVAANHANDTRFGNGLVMGSVDCMYYAVFVKTSEKLLDPLPDTLQAGACLFPPFQISRDHVVKNTFSHCFTLTFDLWP